MHERQACQGGGLQRSKNTAFDPSVDSSAKAFIQNLPDILAQPTNRIQALAPFHECKTLLAYIYTKDHHFFNLSGTPMPLHNLITEIGRSCGKYDDMTARQSSTNASVTENTAMQQQVISKLSFFTRLYMITAHCLSQANE